VFPDVEIRTRKRQKNNLKKKISNVMRKVLALLCLCCAVSIARGQKTYIGIKSGGHIASAFIDHTIFNLAFNAGFEPNFHAGFFLKYLPEKRNTKVHAGLQFSVNYVQKGWRQIFLTNEPPYEAQMNYLEIPVEAIGYFGNKNNYFLTAGFYMEFLTSYSLANEPNQDNLGGQDFYTYEPERDNEIGYGFRTSAGIFRDFSFGQLHLEGFFGFSISNFIDAGDLTTETPDKSNLWTTGVSLGYLFDLERRE